ncbi:MAG: hypothetical protein HY372_01915 [Candidatus Andersenbacteria bacterium]|nr:hypothetical protein [Candidatus Andersenbacteria bacterium]
MPVTAVSAEVISDPVALARDERGLIERLGEGPWQGVLRISSKAGTVRANHYHRHDSHLCYLESGKLRYVYRPADKPDAPLREIIITPGQLFYTPPLIAHAMHFLEDSVFYALTPRSGEQAEYEDDVVRVVLVSPEEAARYGTDAGPR